MFSVRRISGSLSEFAVVVVATAAVVVASVVVLVSAVVVGVMYGLFSLPNIFSLSLLPKSLFHGILPRITLEAVVTLMAVVETGTSLCSCKNGFIVVLCRRASADVIQSRETSGLNSVCPEMGLSVLYKNGVEEVVGLGTCT